MSTCETASFREIAGRNKASVRTLFQLLEQRNIPGFLDLFAEDARQINPFASGLFRPLACGKKELRAYWESVPDQFASISFPIEEIYAMEDPNVVFVSHRGEMTLRTGSGVYANQYYSTFRFNDEGKIVQYVKIFNPIVAARSFGLLDQIR